MTRTVFISYRRNDTAAAAGRIYDRLVRILRRQDVFFDVNAIGGGEDFAQRIRDAISKSDAALIFIGDRWLEPLPQTGKARLWDTDDYVRTEVRAALARNMLVLPVLVGNTRMPAPDALPDDIKAIATRNALTLRHEAFDDDSETIVSAITGGTAKLRPWETRRPLWQRLLALIGGAAAGLLVVLLVAMIHVAVRGQPLAVSIGDAGTMLLIGFGPLLGAVAGWRIAARR